MAATETTNAQYRACVEAGACSPPSIRIAFNDASKRDHPVVYVPWQGASRFCRWAGGRLPTEAEWEFAARGGKEGNRFPWGNERTQAQAKVTWDVQGHIQEPCTSTVGGFPANGFGLFDMAGNAWEWCGDWFGKHYYERSPSEDPMGPTSGEYRVVRGGSWNAGPVDFRVSGRGAFDPSERFYVGFRCVREVASPSTGKEDPDELASQALVTPGGDSQMGPMRVGGDVKEPVEISRVQPAYPEAARKARLQGVVELEAIVTKDGNVDTVRVLRGVDPVLDDASIRAVQQWKYRPATYHGRAVPVFLTVTTTFRLQ